MIFAVTTISEFRIFSRDFQLAPVHNIRVKNFAYSTNLTKKCINSLLFGYLHCITAVATLTTLSISITNNKATS
jgi:hypothetical protein